MVIEVVVVIGMVVFGGHLHGVVRHGVAPRAVDTAGRVFQAGTSYPDIVCISFSTARTVFTPIAVDTASFKGLAFQRSSSSSSSCKRQSLCGLHGLTLTLTCPLTHFRPFVTALVVLIHRPSSSAGSSCASPSLSASRGNPFLPLGTLLMDLATQATLRYFNHAPRNIDTDQTMLSISRIAFVRLAYLPERVNTRFIVRIALHGIRSTI